MNSTTLEITYDVFSIECEIHDFKSARPDIDFKEENIEWNPQSSLEDRKQWCIDNFDGELDYSLHCSIVGLTLYDGKVHDEIIHFLIKYHETQIHDSAISELEGVIQAECDEAQDFLNARG